MTESSEFKVQGHKSGYVALVGKPNVGKSTLLNNYLGQKVAAVSEKPQTTRRRQLGIVTLEQAQIIFVDTPGMHAGDYRLSQFINEEAEFGLTDADLLLFIVDASQDPDEEDRLLADMIKERAGGTLTVLVLNKIDQIMPETYGDRKSQYQSLLDFVDEVEISAITEAGRDKLLDRVVELLPEGPQYFPEGQITATYEREIAEDLIRAAALTYLEDEVPYGILVRMNEYKTREGGLRYINATLFVERESHKGIVIGKGGSMIKKISTLARQEIEEMSGEKVFLELKVKVENNWRNNPDFLRRYGLSHG
jgi:GTP-binding protein Era